VTADGPDVFSVADASARNALPRRRKKIFDRLFTFSRSAREAGYGRGGGVGRGLGKGLDLGDGVGLGVAVGVGVGVPLPVGPWISTIIGEPVLKNPTVASVVCGG
jgi:hypothetical protein